jgi:hypothetical protein
VRVKTPEHPIDRLATFELRDYRNRLQGALRDTATPTERQILAARLAEVLQEQDERAKAELGSLGTDAP